MLIVVNYTIQQHYSQFEGIYYSKLDNSIIMFKLINTKDANNVFGMSTAFTGTYPNSKYSAIDFYNRNIVWMPLPIESISGNVLTGFINTGEFKIKRVGDTLSVETPGAETSILTDTNWV